MQSPGRRRWPPDATCTTSPQRADRPSPIHTDGVQFVAVSFAPRHFQLQNAGLAVYEEIVPKHKRIF